MSAARHLRILAFEPYDGGSHRAVRQSISRHSRHGWTWLTRPARAWKWRMRIGALELLQQAEAAGELDRPIDAIFATSLLSLADLIAGLPPAFRGTPTILYMHENQVAYPRGYEPGDGGGGKGAAGEYGAPGRAAARPRDLNAPSEALASFNSGGGRDVHFALTNLTSVLSADRVIFNSQWNRRSFIEGIERLLAHAPDGRLRDVADRIEGRSIVIWPPVEPPPEPPEPPEGVPAPAGTLASEGGDRASAHRAEQSAKAGDRVLHKPIRVVWPHRWEHDKGPEELLDIADRYSEALNIRWTILGQRFREHPPAFAEFRRRWADRIDHIGFEPDRNAYWAHLRRCHWVLSTARHEFFGIAVVEAMLAGCLPWLPPRLSYVELLPPAARGLSPLNPPSDGESVRSAIAGHLQPARAMNAVGQLDEAIVSAAINAQIGFGEAGGRGRR